MVARNMDALPRPRRVRSFNPSKFLMISFLGVLIMGSALFSELQNQANSSTLGELYSDNELWLRQPYPHFCKNPPAHGLRIMKVLDFKNITGYCLNQSQIFRWETLCGSH